MEKKSNVLATPASTNRVTQDEECDVTWRECVFRSFKLILLDIFWGIIVALVLMSLISLRQVFPNIDICSMLQKESGSKTDFHISTVNYTVDIIWLFLFYSIPLATFLLVAETIKKQSLWKFIKVVNKRWSKVVNLSLLFFGVDLTYRIIGFFLFSFNNDHKYPWWFPYPLNINWIIATIAVSSVSAKLWTIKKSSHLVLQCGISQEMVQQDLKKVYKSLRNKMLLSVVLPGINGIIFNSLFLMFQVSKESHRAILIPTIAILSCPLWLILDYKGKKSLSWKQQVKQAIDSIGNNDHSLNQYEQSDPICHNGFVFSGFILTGVIITIRMLQANMETLTSKILMGILASCLESFFVAIEPCLKRSAKKAAKSFKRIASSHVAPFQVDDLDNMRDTQAEESEERVYRWHRAHTIVYVNRLEMFSIIFSHFLMMMSVRVKNRSMELVGETISSECESSSIVDFLISMIVLCSLEVLIESCTYIYLLRVEKLQLVEATNRFRFKFCFLYFALITGAYFTTMCLSMAYTVLSCDGMDESFYIYHCI